jgi:hypothetical protein
MGWIISLAIRSEGVPGTGLVPCCPWGLRTPTVSLRLRRARDGGNGSATRLGP